MVLAFVKVELLITGPLMKDDVSVSRNRISYLYREKSRIRGHCCPFKGASTRFFETPNGLISDARPWPYNRGYSKGVMSDFDLFTLLETFHGANTFSYKVLA